MDKAQFWQLIEETKRESSGDGDAQVELIDAALEQLPGDEIESFYAIFEDYRDRAYTCDLWAAAYIMNGGCSDDMFMDFRSWLIAQGEDIYFRALADPESLTEVDVEFEEANLEQLNYVAWTPYENKTGMSLLDVIRAKQEAAGDCNRCQSWSSIGTTIRWTRSTRYWRLNTANTILISRQAGLTDTLDGPGGCAREESKWKN